MDAYGLDETYPMKIKRIQVMQRPLIEKKTKTSFVSLKVALINNNDSLCLSNLRNLSRFVNLR